MKSSKVLSPFVLFVLLLTGCGSVASAAVPEATVVPPVTAGQNVVAEGRLVPLQYVDLAFAGNGGVVAEVTVRAGQAVRAGQVLARLESTALAAQLAQAEAGLAAAQARLAQAQAAPQPSDVAAAQARLAQAQALAEQAGAQRDQLSAAPRADEITVAQQEVTQAEAQLHYAEAIHDASIAGPNEWVARQQRDAAAAAVEIARARLRLLQAGTAWNERRAAGSGAEAAQAQVALAQAELDRLSAAPREEDLAVLRAGVAEAQAAVDAAGAALADLELRAPIAGVVAELGLKPGETAIAGQPVLTLADTSAWLVETDDLTELEVVRVQTGQSVAVAFDALPDASFAGQVTEVSPKFEEKQGDVTYTVTITLTGVPPELRWGMTAEVTITAE